MNTPAPFNDDQKAATPGDDKRWNIRALIVDDDVPIRELMIDYLARFNIHASGVTDGAAQQAAIDLGKEAALGKAIAGLFLVLAHVVLRSGAGNSQARLGGR